jgi:hypothetical protein
MDIFSNIFVIFFLFCVRLSDTCVAWYGVANSYNENSSDFLPTKLGKALLGDGSLP